jgi:hypothetical protein
MCVNSLETTLAQAVNFVDRSMFACGRKPFMPLVVAGNERSPIGRNGSDPHRGEWRCAEASDNRGEPEVPFEATTVTGSHALPFSRAIAEGSQCLATNSSNPSNVRACCQDARVLFASPAGKGINRETTRVKTPHRPVCGNQGAGPTLAHLHGAAQMPASYPRGPHRDPSGRFGSQ